MGGKQTSGPMTSTVAVHWQGVSTLGHRAATVY